MAWLIDTCVLSEPTPKAPNPGVNNFIDHLDYGETYISVISVAEIWKGINKLPSSRRRDALEDWLKRKLLPSFTNPPLPIDLEVAWKWGELRAALDEQGNAMPAVDCILAATALVHDLTLVTRNEVHFAHCRCRVFNPWR